MKQRTMIGFVASKTVISILTSIRMKEGQNLLRRWIGTISRTKQSLRRIHLMHLSRTLSKKFHNTSIITKKVLYSMTTLGLVLPNPPWKRLNGKSCSIYHIPQILSRPITTCFVRWNIVWLISSSSQMKKMSWLVHSLKRRTFLPSR